MKKHKIKLFSLVSMLATLLLIQCREEEDNQSFIYLSKSKSEINIHGDKLAHLIAEDATEFVFWEFENSVAVHVLEKEELAENHKAVFSQATSLTHLYDLLSKGHGDEYTRRAIHLAEKRVQQIRRSYHTSLPAKTGLSSQNRTAISYACAQTSAINGASFEYKWSKKGYDFYTCKVNKSSVGVAGSNLTEIAVSVHPEDNGVLNIYENTSSGTMGSIEEIVDYDVYPGYYFTWYFQYGDPLQMMTATANSNAGVECPRMHLCLAGDY